MEKYVNCSRIKKCCVKNCINKSSIRHRFPRSDPNIFKMWLLIIKPNGYEKLTFDQQYNRYYVCSGHFAPECFVVGTRRGLTRDALPTIGVTGLPEELLEEALPSTSKSYGAEDSGLSIKLKKEVEVMPITTQHDANLVISPDENLYTQAISAKLPLESAVKNLFEPSTSSVNQNYSSKCIGIPEGELLKDALLSTSKICNVTDPALLSTSKVCGAKDFALSIKRVPETKSIEELPSTSNRCDAIQDIELIIKQEHDYPAEIVEEPLLKPKIVYQRISTVKQVIKPKTLLEKKRDMIEKILSEVNSIENEKEYTAIEQILSTVRPTLTALRENVQRPTTLAKKPVLIKLVPLRTSISKTNTQRQRVKPY